MLRSQANYMNNIAIGVPYNEIRITLKLILSIRYSWYNTELNFDLVVELGYINYMLCYQHS